MTIAESPKARRLVRARARMELASIDFNREVKTATVELTQTRVASIVKLTQARVSQIVAGTPLPVSGFSGATPREIAQRFAAGELTEDQAIDELGRWDYSPKPAVAPFDDLWEPGEGTWADVEQAWDDDLIADEVYEGARLLRGSLSKAGK